MLSLSKIEGRYKKSKRVGRGAGSGRGKTSGRGTKGAKSRSGYKRRWGNEGGQLPLFRKIPIRGFSRGDFKKEVFIVNLSMLNRCFTSGEVVNFSSLRKKSLMSTKKFEKIKVLGKGDVDKPLKLEVDGVSASAKEKIIKAKGSVTLVHVRSH